MLELCIIPARIGSKRLPKKNIMKFNGRPLIEWTIISAIDSGIFKKIIVSTDDEKIAKISLKAGAEVPFLRPKELSNDKATSNQVIDHALNYFNYPMNFALLQPTSPLRTYKHLKNAFHMYKKVNAESLVSIVEGKKLDWIFELLPNKILNKKNLKKKEMVPYYPNGALYFCETSVYLEKKNLFSENTYGFIMNKLSSIDIDNYEDFILAEIIFKEIYNKN